MIDFVKPMIKNPLRQQISDQKHIYKPRLFELHKSILLPHMHKKYVS